MAVTETETKTKNGEGDEQGPGCVASRRRMIAEKMRERRAAELRRWGAPEGATAEQLALAGSARDCVVPVLSLAYRRFRTEVLEPRLAVPMPKGESKGKGKKKRKGTMQGRYSPATMAIVAVVTAAEVDKAQQSTKKTSVLPKFKTLWKRVASKFVSRRVSGVSPTPTHPREQ